MATWTDDELARIAGATKAQVTSRREDGTLRPAIVGTVVGPSAHPVTVRLVPLDG